MPEALLVPAQPGLQTRPDGPIGTLDDPIAQILTGEAAIDGTDPNAIEDETAVEEIPTPAPRRYQRKRSRPDDWKKNYSIFGGS